VWNSRIIKNFSGLAGILTRKMPSDRPKTPQRPLFVGPYLSAPSSVSHNSKTLQEKVAQAFRRYQVRSNPTSGARSNTRAITDKKQGKMSQRFRAFFSRTAAFARRVLPTLYKLTRGPGCVGKMTTPATTCNSQFASSFPRLTGIFTGKARKNSFGTPTSRSHNSLVQIRFMQNLYHWKLDVESFPTICCMTHFEFRKTSKTALENRVKKGYARENRGRFGGGLAWKDKIATWQLHGSRGIITRRAT
jgi:hypothetical protein